MKDINPLSERFARHGAASEAPGAARWQQGGVHAGPIPAPPRMGKVPRPGEHTQEILEELQ